MADEARAIGSALANVPVGALIQNVALGIAQGQAALDVESIRNAQMMSGYGPNTIDGQKLQMEDYRVAFGRDENGEPNLVSMMELGFTPSFYQFIDTLIEVKMSISVERDTSASKKNKGTQTSLSVSRSRGWFWQSNTVKVTSTPVDATYSSKYNYAAEGSSLVRTKLVPVPPPAILEERIRALVEVEEAISSDANTTVEKATPVDGASQILG